MTESPGPEDRGVRDHRRFVTVMVILVCGLFLGALLLLGGIVMDTREPEVPPPFQNQQPASKPPGP